MNRNFLAVSRKYGYLSDSGEGLDGIKTKADLKKLHGERLNKFPIEEARLRSAPIFLALYAVAVVAYGWVLQVR